MRTLIFIRLFVFCGCLGAVIGSVQVFGSARADTTCNVRPIMGPELQDKICWDCIFPIAIGSVPTGPGVPGDATNSPVCLCNSSFGVPLPSLTFGYWEIARLVEVVRFPGCFPALGGIRIPTTAPYRIGTDMTVALDQDTQKAFYHFHYYAFPLATMLGGWNNASCLSDGIQDFDIMYISEIDPSMNLDELSLFVFPETILFASFPAQAACIADGVAATAGSPIDELFWCAGTWGGIYPIVSTVTADHDSRIQAGSKVVARGLYSAHRKGIAKRTMGNDAVCRAKVEPRLPKSMYKISYFHPIAEANSTHPIGRSTFAGLEHRAPIPGWEDQIHVIFRWNDCCLVP